MAEAASAAALFEGQEALVRVIDDRVLDALDALGPYREEPKKTSIHLVRGVGFADTHPRKGSLVLNPRIDHLIAGPRVVKTERVSRNRRHNEVKLVSLEEVAAEVVGCLRNAYALG